MDNNSSNINDISDILINIKNSYHNNIRLVVMSMPSLIWLIPLISFIMIPSQEKSIFLYGAVCITLLGMITTPKNIANELNFTSNFPSFHGMVLGYLAGYNTLKAFYNYETGYGFSTIVLTIILGVFITGYLYGFDNISDKILSISLGIFTGIIIGALFAHIESKMKDKDNS